VHRVTLVFIIGLVVSLGASAGDLAPPGSPAPTMKTMQEVYDQVAQANRAAGGGGALLFYPHVMEQTGSINNTPNTYDSMFVFVATGPYVGTGLKKGTPSRPGKSLSDVTVRLYLYDNLGQPARSASAAPVAFPAEYTIGYSTPRASVTLENLFQAAGGYAASPFEGFAVLSVSTGDWNDVAVQAFTINSHTSAFDLALSPMEPVVIQDSASVIKNTAPAAKETK
jgi:hypothetical protein